MENRLFSIEKKVALVTGAANGMGQAIAIAMAAQGAQVVGVDYAPCSATASRIQNGTFKEIRANLANKAEIESCIEQTLSWFGRLDILVNCAGIIRREAAEDFSEKDWDDVLGLNLKSVFLLCQHAGRVFLKQGSGKIINIASLLSFQGGIRAISYTAAKSGIAGITRTLANEWAARNINVNAIAPGYIATALNVQLQNDPKRSQEILTRIPAGRWGKPDDVAGTAIFLASPASDYINGTVIVVDGGWMSR